MTDGAVQPECQLIVFSLHGERYGLPIACVREIIRYTPPQVTATARGIVRGMITLRGRVLPVLDLSSRLGRILEVSGSTRILVIEVSTGVVALIVDTVEGVVKVAPDRIEAVPGAVSDDALGHQIAAIGDQLIMLIDPDRGLGSALPAAPAGERPAAPAGERPAPAAEAAPPRGPPQRQRDALGGEGALSQRRVSGPSLTPGWSTTASAEP